MPVPLSFVAIGDSFTEGLDDPAEGSRGGFRGWADRVAEQFAEVEPAFTYANLGIRGRKLDQILDDQLPRALELRPELVSLAGGTNDVLRPRVDLNRMARRFQDAVRQLRENGSQVVLFQSVDPTPRSRLIGRALPRIKALTTIVEETAEQYQCVVVRLWSAKVFAHPAMWSEDRLHLSSEGHARVAGAFLEALGLGDHAVVGGPRPVRRAAPARAARRGRPLGAAAPRTVGRPPAARGLVRRLRPAQAARPRPRHLALTRQVSCPESPGFVPRVARFRAPSRQVLRSGRAAPDGRLARMPRTARRQPWAVAVVADALAVVLFAVIGRASHDESVGVRGVWHTAWPFLVGAGVGLALTAYSHLSPTTIRAGIRVWACAVVIGLVVRKASGGGTAIAVRDRGRDRARRLPGRLAGRTDLAHLAPPLALTTQP